MKSTITLLEKQVQRAVGRLRELRDERNRLRGELENAQKSLEDLHQEGPADVSAGTSPELVSRVISLKSTLREAIQELRGE